MQKIWSFIAQYQVSQESKFPKNLQYHAKRGWQTWVQGVCRPQNRPGQLLLWGPENLSSNLIDWIENQTSSAIVKYDQANKEVLIELYDLNSAFWFKMDFDEYIDESYSD